MLAAVALATLTKPSTAGSRVCDEVTTIDAISAAPMPSPVVNDRPISKRPSSETTTAAPAKLTDRLAVSRGHDGGAFG